MEAGDELIVNIEESCAELPDKGIKIPLTPLSPVMVDILEEGGLVEYLKKNGTYILPE